MISYLRLAITLNLECVQVNLTHGTKELDDSFAAAGQILDVNQVETARDRSAGEVREVPINVRAVVVLTELTHLRTTQSIDGNHALFRQVANLHSVGKGIAFVSVVSIVRIGHHRYEIEVFLGLDFIVHDRIPTINGELVLLPWRRKCRRANCL